MKEEILDLEADFANNEYFGTNVWTEEKYRVLSGSFPVLLSAPHSVNQIRGEDVRKAEKYTGAIVRYLSRLTNSYAIFQMFTHADPNVDEGHNYKSAVVNLIEAYNLKFFLDIHSSTFMDNTDIDIVTNHHESLCGENSLIEKIMDLGKEYDVLIDEKNSPNSNKKDEIIGVTSLVCGTPSIRIVINNKKLDLINNEEKFWKICKFMESLITYINDFLCKTN